MTETDWKALRQALLAPFRPEQIHWRKQSEKNGMAVPYLEEEDIRRRLDDVVPSWGCELRPSVNGHAAYICCITLNGVSREDVGECGREVQGFEHKTAATDAFKRAAQRWGVGNFLDHLRPLDFASVEYGRHPKLTAEMVANACRRAGWEPGGNASPTGDRSTPASRQDAAPRRPPSATMERSASYAGASVHVNATPPAPSNEELELEAPALVCSTPDCGKVLKEQQRRVSLQVFGEPLCPDCQRAEAARRSSGEPQRRQRPAPN